MKDSFEPTVYEKCVSCGIETEYTIDQPIVTRNYYVEGAGQLCEACCEKIYS